jgi:putative ABC transport system permease protein
MLNDLRFCLRLFRRSPGFVVVAIVTLALGIGINTAIFSIFDAVLLRPLPYPEPDRLVQIWETNQKAGGRDVVSPVNLMEWRESTSAFAAAAAYGWQSAILTGRGDPERLIAARVSGEFFDVFRIPPAFGRAIGPADVATGAERVVVLSHRTWRERFGANPRVVGTFVTLDSVSTRIVGVMPEGFAAPDQGPQIWVPLVLAPQQLQRGSHFLFAVGRLAPGVDVAAATAQIATVAIRAERESPGTNTDLRGLLVPLHEQTIGDFRPVLVVLLGSVGIVLLIACSNVASLLLARSAARRQEFAVRTALGAGRARLARQLLIESCVLGLVGGWIGLLLAGWAVEAIIAIDPGAIPRAREIGVDARVLAFNLGLSAAAAMLFGVAPALGAARGDLHLALKDGGRAGQAGRGSRLRSALVVAEVALALVLLSAGALIVRSFLQLRGVDTGFEPSRVLTMMVSLPPARYAGPGARVQAWERILERVQQTPGVSLAAASSELPFTGSRTATSFTMNGSQEGFSRPPNTDYRIVSNDYFRVMGIRLLQGRGFTDADSADAQKVIVVNDEFARIYVPDGDVIGRRIALRNPPVEREIVGVVSSVRHGSFRDEIHPAAYVPFRQDTESRIMFAVQGANADALANLAGPLRAAVRQVDTDLALYSVRTMEERLNQSVAPERLNSMAVALFAAVALTLAMVGTYGLLAFTVAQRTHELGVRVALGARREDLVRLVLGQGLSLVVVGVVLGSAGSLAVNRALSSVLFGANPFDLRTLAAVAGLLLGVSVAACLVPALRAARVDPLLAIRGQ